MRLVKKIRLTSYQLKWIAIITMVIDHTGAVLFPECMLMREIGRVSFPIFCFLLVEGFFHTHDLYQYMIRLGTFAVISEIPYDLAFRETILEFTHQNVFFTLLLGVLMMYVLQMAGEWPTKVVEVLLVMWAAVCLKTDYSFKGILLILVFYLFRQNKRLKLAGGILWNFLWKGNLQKYGAIAMFPIALYNGERGKGIKYFFYIFYTMHLFLLFLMKRLIG